MIQTRSYFTSGANGPTGILFRKYNRPLATSFFDLFESILFKNESADRATISANGHARIADAANVVIRSDTYLGSAGTRFTLATHLPNVLTAITADHALFATTTANGMIVDRYYYSPGGTLTRSDFMVRSDVTIASADNFVTVTEAPAGSKHFDLAFNAAFAGAYMVMTDAGDLTPSYLLDAFVAGPFYLDPLGANGILTPQYDNTDEITLAHTAAGSSATLNLTNIALEVGAGTGLQIRDNIDTIAFTTTYVRTAGNQVIAGTKEFTTHPQFNPAYAAPTTDVQYTPKKYVDDLDALCVHLAGAETITGAKLFTTHPQFSPAYVAPTVDEQYAPKKYVDDMLAAGFGVWELNAGPTHGVQTINAITACLATGNYSFAGGMSSTASTTCAFAYGSVCLASGSYSVAMGTGCHATAYGSVALGANNNSTGTNSFSIGDSNLASATGSIAMGHYTKASATGSMSVCMQSVAHVYGSFAKASYKHLAPGDSQELSFGMHVTTIDAAGDKMLLGDAVTAGFTVPTDCMLNVHVRLSAICTLGAAAGDGWMQDIEFGVKNIAGALTIVANTSATVANVHVVAGNVTYKLYNGDAALAAITAVVSILGTAINITVTGLAAHTIQWNAEVSWVVQGYNAYSV